MQTAANLCLWRFRAHCCPIYLYTFVSLVCIKYTHAAASEKDMSWCSRRRWRTSATEATRGIIRWSYLSLVHVFGKQSAFHRKSTEVPSKIKYIFCTTKYKYIKYNIDVGSREALASGNIYIYIIALVIQRYIYIDQLQTFGEC